MTLAHRAATARATVSTVKNIALGLTPRLPGDARFDVMAITSADVLASVASGIPGAHIESFAVEQDSRGTTDRSRVRVGWNDAGRAAGLPEAFFAKGTPSQASSRVLCSSFGLSTYEVRFYAQIHPAVAETTMTPVLAREGHSGRYLLLFEDLSSTEGVQFWKADDEPPLAYYESLVETLAIVHGRFWRSPRFETDLAWIQTYARRPGYPVAHPIVRMCEKRFMKQDRDIPDTVRRLTHFYVENRPALDRAWAALPSTLVHGDCHLGNTYARADGTAGLYDWQNLHKMNGLRDFAYLMTASVPTALRQKHERALLERYLDALATNGAGNETPSLDAAFDTYRLLAMDGWIAAFTTASIGGMQDDVVETSLTRAVQTLTDLDTESALRAAV